MVMLHTRRDFLHFKNFIPLDSGSQILKVLGVY